MRPLPLAAVALALAGCVAPPPGDLPAAVALPDWADFFPQNHDHFDAAEHVASWNAEQLAWLPLVEKGESPGAHALDVHGDLLALGVVGDAGRGVALFDVAEAASPKLLGTWHREGLRGGDRTVSFSADGGTVFVGAEQPGPDTGVFAVDVSDPKKPKEAGFFLMPRSGAHTVFAVEIDGVQYVYAFGMGLYILSYDAAADEFALVARYATVTPQQLAANPALAEPEYAHLYGYHSVYGHDVWVGEHEKTGRPLAYLAYAWEGLKILDVSDPSLPREIATFVPTGVGAPWYVHTVDVARLGDRVVAVVGSEVFSNRHFDAPSPVWVVDVTDPTRPELLATWTNPAGVGSQSMLFSAHDFRIAGDRLVLAHYHGGVWVLDLLALLDGKPAEVAAFLPNGNLGAEADGATAAEPVLTGVPFSFDVVVKGGVIYTADELTGLYAHRVSG